MFDLFRWLLGLKRRDRVRSHEIHMPCERDNERYFDRVNRKNRQEAIKTGRQRKERLINYDQPGD